MASGSGRRAHGGGRWHEGRGKGQEGRGINEVLKDVEPGVTIQFNQMDITDLRSDAEFFQWMLKAGVYQPEEVRALLEAVVE